MSRYIHLNPVRVGKLGLNKSQQQRIRAGASAAPDPKLVQERIALLREHRWSSYRAYIGLAAKPAWLECEEVLGLGGGQPQERRRKYRNYVETAVREGLLKSPWEELREKIVLGSQEFVQRLGEVKLNSIRESEATQQWGRLRPDFAAVVACVEQIKGEKWTDFGDRHGDSGRDLALYLGRKHGGLKLEQLARAVGIKSDAAVAMCLKRYEKRLQIDRKEQNRLEQATQLLIVRM